MLDQGAAASSTLDPSRAAHAMLPKGATLGAYLLLGASGMTPDPSLNADIII